MATTQLIPVQKVSDLDPLANWPLDMTLTSDLGWHLKEPTLHSHLNRFNNQGWNKAARTIFYGWRALLLAENMSDKKKRSHLSFFYIFSSDMQDWVYLTCRFSRYKLPFSLKICQFSPFYFSFLRHQLANIFIFIFFPPTCNKNPCRDPSSVEYSAGSLSNPDL